MFVRRFKIRIRGRGRLGLIKVVLGGTIIQRGLRRLIGGGERRGNRLGRLRRIWNR